MSFFTFFFFFLRKIFTRFDLLLFSFCLTMDASFINLFSKSILWYTEVWYYINIIVSITMLNYYKLHTSFCITICLKNKLIQNIIFKLTYFMPSWSLWLKLQDILFLKESNYCYLYCEPFVVLMFNRAHM